MKIFLTALIALSSQVALSQIGLQPKLAAAREAYQKKDFTSYYALMKEAENIHPYHQGVLYQCGLAAALNHKPEESIQYLTRAIHIQASFKLENNPDLESLYSREDFRNLLALQKKLKEVIISTDTAFTLKDKSLHIESVAFNPIEKEFYLGSIHQRKIIKRTSAGVVSDFTKPAFEGMTSVFGLKVDPKRKLLWACSSPMPEMMNYDSTLQSAVFQFDLNSGQLKKIFYPAEKKNYIFGDLTVNSKGEVFVSDTQTNTIFSISKQNKLEPYFTSAEFWNIQGISFSDDDQYLFISDYIKGLYRLDTKTKTLLKLNSLINASLKGIDGLTYYNGSLIAIQNGVTPFRVSRLFLSKDLEKIVSQEIIDRAHPAFNEPTLGTMTGNTFYYVANSQWSGYDQQHKIKPIDQLEEIVILKTDLR